jgi:hypothetical protein
MLTHSTKNILTYVKENVTVERIILTLLDLFNAASLTRVTIILLIYIIPL